MDFHFNLIVFYFSSPYRMIEGQIQEFNSLCSYMQQFNPDQFLEAMSDFHLLIFIATMDMLPMKVM